MGPLRKRDADATGRRGHGVIGHRHHAAGVTGTPGGGADGSGAAVYQLGPLLLGQAETHQSPVLRVREGQGHDGSQDGTNGAAYSGIGGSSTPGHSSSWNG